MNKVADFKGTAVSGAGSTASAKATAQTGARLAELLHDSSGQGLANFFAQEFGLTSLHGVSPSDEARLREAMLKALESMRPAPNTTVGTYTATKLALEESGVTVTELRDYSKMQFALGIGKTDGAYLERPNSSTDGQWTLRLSQFNDAPYNRGLIDTVGKALAKVNASLKVEGSF
jgi:hypothetical protein